MEYGICLLMSIPMRATNSHQSEMVSQLLFGETYSVLESTSEWLRIVTTDCNYEGWISTKQHSELNEEEFAAYWNQPHYKVPYLYLLIKEIAGRFFFPVCLGSQFPMPQDGVFTMAGLQYGVELMPEETLPPVEGLTETQNRLRTIASQYLHASYLWGGRTPAGIDCSGFVQNVYSCFDIQLPRDASQQVTYGQTVDFIQEAQVGDVAFFGDEEGRIVHTGIVCGPQQIIHASGYVHIDTLDETGIFHHGLRRYTHQLRTIKRILE
ncbi:MAG: C40 family peptidase [Bacteroidales bacterium]|nr:C40 family peptidase [Bacteroidales bacterium]